MIILAELQGTPIELHLFRDISLDTLEFIFKSIGLISGDLYKIQ